MKHYVNTHNLARLASISSELSPELQAAIEEKATTFFKDLTQDVGEFLCDGSNLHFERQNEDVIRTLVQCVPKALEYKDVYGDIPIDCACNSQLGSSNSSSAQFIPVLAEEGIKHNVGGEGMRGGLLCSSQRPNIFEDLLDHASSAADPLMHLYVMKRLRAMGLLTKEDIRTYDLLEHCGVLSDEKFMNFFVDWDPTVLKETDGEGKSLLHAASTYCTERKNFAKAFATTFRATLRHYPQELGFLLLKDSTSSQITPMELARQKLGRAESWQLISKCLDESDQVKILEKDKKTNIYPFMLASTGDKSELDLIYYLMQRDPLTFL